MTKKELIEAIKDLPDDLEVQLEAECCTTSPFFIYVRNNKILFFGETPPQIVWDKIELINIIHNDYQL